MVRVNSKEDGNLWQGDAVELTISTDPKSSPDMPSSFSDVIACWIILRTHRAFDGKRFLNALLIDLTVMHEINAWADEPEVM